jgi:hypothetical protein
MKKEKRVYLIDMQNRLQKRMNYRHPQAAFDTLLRCYALHKKHYTGWAGVQRRKGWMTPDKAREFAKYCGYPIDQPSKTE